MLPRRGESLRAGDTVHIVIYECLDGKWLVGCNETFRVEDSDYVDCMKEADFVDETPNCLGCIAGEGRWDADGVSYLGREHH